MTEGNIANWRLKEGDTFTAGDVLLEIETDKATMDVEAQDDGVLFKIMHGEGAKGVKVGERIAVTAEEGDDLSNLDVPEADSSAAKQEDKSEKESAEQPRNTQEQGSQHKTSTSAATQEGKDTKAAAAPLTSSKEPVSRDASAEKMGGKVQKQKYTLLPSVAQLLLQNGLSRDDADQIPASGPGGRLLKGDILAYLGQINKEYPAEQSARLDKLSKLDLSNIQIARKDPSVSKAIPSKTEAKKPTSPAETEIAIPISLSAVIATQKRVQDTLGIFLPLSTFIARASELANESLPASKTAKPTADSLFNSVLGLDRVPQRSSSRGNFIPQITGITPPPVRSPARPAKKADIIDLLSPGRPRSQAPKPVAAAAAPVGISATGNLFAVTAKQGDERKAAEYLERMKLALEKEPGRLVL